MALTDKEQVEQAHRSAVQLITLCDAHFPYDVRPSGLTPAGDAELDNWELVAPAFVFAGCACVLSIFAILKASLPRNGSQDAFVQLRRLYEYAVTFSWIAIDPAVNTKAWLAHDFKSRLKMNRELKDLGLPGLDPAVETKFQNHIAACPKPMPDLRARTVEADAYWAGKISTHSRKQPLPTKHMSFETLYTNIR